MKTLTQRGLLLAALLLSIYGTTQAAVQIVSITPSRKSPQPIGTPIRWNVAATDSNSGPLTFQFNIARLGAPLALVKDFNVGTVNSGVWTPQPFVWTPTGVEGTYQVQIVIKDFTTGETASRSTQFTVTPLVSGAAPVVAPTVNPLVALFSAPSCAAGSFMRAAFQQQSLSTPPAVTNWVACHPPASMTFEVAGMYPSTAYRIFSQTLTGGAIVNGSALTFTTGALPAQVPFPKFTVVVPAGPQADPASVIVYNPVQFGAQPVFPDVATDLAGNIIWYYRPFTQSILTRPLPGGNMLTLQTGPAWNPASGDLQLLREIDLAGNIVRETNTGIIQQQLLAMGASNGGPCDAIPKPAPVGSACLDYMHHDAIETLPNGYTALLVEIDKIFPPGTQGDTSGLPVCIMGDMIVVLNANWQVVWYFDSFQHDGGGAQLDINRRAILNEGCVLNQPGCPPMFLLGPGIAPVGKDWLHANSLYYSPQDANLIFSARHQDWIIKIDYSGGSGTGNILWRMGPDGDFTFNNINNDPWPWFSHQHDVGVEKNGVMTLFDNGNTRVAPPPLGLGGGNSRGMALTFNETTRQVTPVMSVDLGVYANAMSSAQLLSNGNYFFEPANVFLSLNAQDSYAIEILPSAGTLTGTQVLNVQGTQSYRAFRMRNLYLSPTT